MKNLLIYIFTFSLLITVSTSCKDENDSPGTPKGTPESATYDHTTKTFTLHYKNGDTEKVNATIDNSTDPVSANYKLSDGTMVYIIDASVSGKATISKKVNRVSEFVYDGMSNFYLWADEVTGKEPTINDYNPDKYFYSILNNIDTKHSWSWITDDISSLMAGFKGEETGAYGFSPLALWYDSGRTRLVSFVRFVYPNTPAANAGLVRGDVIDKINGQQITLSNYDLLYGANVPTTFTVLDKNFQNPREVTITPTKVSTDPVFFTDTYEIEGKKIGYLFYTNFYGNYNESLHRAFSNFKAERITDLVLDLRYNPGGDINAAIYLASMIAPEADVKNNEVFTIMNYNSYVNAAFDRQDYDRNGYLGEYDDKKYSNPLTANLNLNKVYILTTASSASASELLTFCLMPYMDVEHIGETTSGKYTASWTIHAYDDYDGSVQPVYEESRLSATEKKELKDWGMQPIVGRYTDKDNNDFIATDGLIPEYEIETEEYNTKTWKPIGDVEDYLFAKAISLITGTTYKSTMRSAGATPLKETGLYSPTEKILRRGVLVDAPGILPIE